jgi:uncharacterized protein involved in response to NO
MFGSPPNASLAVPAFLAKGFRPFFLAAALYVGFALPVWSLTLAGHLAAPSYLDPVTWHAHEMIFGFGVAVIAGFLLTAVGNWTQSETAVGAPLLALVVAWFMGRVVMMASNTLPPMVVAVGDSAFLPLLTLTVARPIVRSRNSRNYAVVVALVVLGASNVAIHLDALGVPGAMRRRASLVAVDVVTFFLVLVTGRVVAMFTKNVTRDAACRNHPELEVSALVAIGAVLAVDAIGVQAPPVAAPVLATAGLLVGGRAIHWGAFASRREPMLWILHLGHAFLPIGLLLRAAAEVTARVPVALGMHAITVGSIGALCLGMMARVALGHTGRLVATPRGMGAAFAMVLFAALARMSASLVSESVALPLLVGSAMSVAVAFLAYAWIYGKVLITPRVDGKAG